MNKNIFRNRTIIGAVCILLAVLVCFGITPLFNAGLKAQTKAVRIKAEVIPRGTYITADMVEVYTRGASGMSDAIATSLDEVVGRYTDVELRKSTDVNTGWLSSEPLTQYEYLTKLDGSKVAISVTIPTFAKGGSGKVEAGDIIMLFATDKDTGETTQPPELKYVEVLAATQSSGADKEYQAPQDDEEENPEESLPSTITLLVNTEQAQLLAHLEESNSLHLAFVYRGTRENAEKFLAAQDQFFVEPEEDTAAQDGEQGEVSDDNNVADNTGDNAAAMNPQRNRRLRIPMANKQKQMLAVWGSPGGGKTVTAVKLALELSKRKKNVVLVFTDVTAPTLPAVVSEKKLPDVSVGELLAAPGMTQEQVLKTCVPCEKNPYISFLGYKAGENVFTHAEYSKEKAVDMLVLLRHIADYVIVDCTSLLTGNVLATTALEVADDVLRVCSCDLKAISYFSSYLSLVADRKFKPEQHIKVLSNTRPYQGGSEYENSFGGVKYRLPYLSSLEEQAATLKLLEPLSGKEAKTYEPVIAAIAGEVFGDGK